jgi:hypothetical protein
MTNYPARMPRGQALSFPTDDFSRITAVARMSGKTTGLKIKLDAKKHQ